MAAVKDAKTVGQPFSNASEYVRVTYDFAKDGGATGALDLITADGALVIEEAWLTVKTACTSGGSATLKWGTNGDDDRFLNTTQGAVANLTAAATLFPVEDTDSIPCPVLLASGGKLVMTIGTAALTAGKIEFVARVAKA